MWENGLPSNSYKIRKLGVFWKIYDIGYTMGTKIFKIEEEMTEKMKPKVANPPSKNRQNSLLTIYTPLKSCPFMTCNENLFHMLVEGKIKVFLYPWPDMSSLTLVP